MEWKSYYIGYIIGIIGIIMIILGGLLFTPLSALLMFEMFGAICSVLGFLYGILGRQFEGLRDGIRGDLSREHEKTRKVLRTEHGETRKILQQILEELRH